MARALVVLALLAAASPAAAQEVVEPHRYRVMAAVGGGGTPVDSGVTEQLRITSYDLEIAYDVSVAGQVWMERWLGLGGELWLHHLDLTGPSLSAVITYAVLFTGSVAARQPPSEGGAEAAIELAAGPALVRWWVRDESADAPGLVLRLAARLGMGTQSGFTWHLRPWFSTTVGWIGPSDLSTAGVSAGIAASLGWGWS